MNMSINDYSIISGDYASSDNSGTAFLAFKYLPLLIKRYTCGKKTLDYGCGSGNSSRYLQSIDLDVEGVDISAEMLEEAAKMNTSINYTLIKSGELPYKDHYFDIVFSSFVLFEIGSIAELVKIFTEVYRVLKSSGIFIFITGSAELYSHEWLSLDVNFQENKNLKSGDIAKVLLKDVNLIVYDYYWTDHDYTTAIEQTKFAKKITLFPLGDDTDGYPWIDETKYPPYSVYVLSKK